MSSHNSGYLLGGIFSVSLSLNERRRDRHDQRRNQVHRSVGHDPRVLAVRELDRYWG